MERNICNKLNEQDEHYDVIVRVDGIDFKAHKHIMCGCSQYFRTLFTGIWYNPEKRVYCIPGVSPDVMELIIQYAYTGQTEITVSNVEHLLAAADYLDVQGLLRQCCDFLKFQLCPLNCISIWRYAEVYSCRELCDCAHTFILQHFEKISAPPTPEFLEMSLSELSGILEQDRLNVKEEETVFKAVMTWIEHDLKLRSPDIITLLPKVRLGLMSVEFFQNKVRKSQLVKKYKKCRPVINRSMKILSDIKEYGLSDMVFPEPTNRPRVPHSVLFAIGGCSERGLSSTIEAYDCKAQSWRVIACPERKPWKSSLSGQYIPRAYHNTAFLDGFLYFVGGDDYTKFLNSVCKFNPVAQTWHEVAPMHSRRCYVSVAVLDGYIYAMGGFDGIGQLNTVECYKPSTNQWHYVAQMHKQRNGASATTLHGKVYICGGFNGNEHQITAECFNPQSGQWTFIASMLEHRSNMGIITLNNQIYVVGGFNGNEYLKSVEVYNPQSGTWSRCSPMLHPRINFGIEVMDERLYVVGGFNGRRSISKTEYYDEKPDKWFVVQNMNVERSGLSCCVISALPNITDYTYQGPNMI